MEVKIYRRPVNEPDSVYVLLRTGYVTVQQSLEQTAEIVAHELGALNDDLLMVNGTLFAYHAYGGIRRLTEVEARRVKLREGRIKGVQKSEQMEGPNEPS